MSSTCLRIRYGPTFITGVPNLGPNDARCYATAVFRCERSGMLCYGRPYLGVDKTAAFDNLQRDGRGVLRLRRHYTVGAFAGAVVAAAPNVCTVRSGRKPIRTFCALSPGPSPGPCVPNGRTADISALLKKRRKVQVSSSGSNFPGKKLSSPSFLFKFGAL